MSGATDDLPDDGIFIDQHHGRLRLARIEAGHLADFDFEPVGGLVRPGGLYRAAVVRVEKVAGLIFLDLGGGMNGVLRARSISVIPSEGQRLVVRTVAEPMEAAKAWRCEAADTSDFGLKGPLGELAPPPDLLAAWLARRATTLPLHFEGDELTACLHKSGFDCTRHAEGSRLFSHAGIDDSLEAIVSGRFAFGEGGLITIEAARAGIAIDVDGGRQKPHIANRRAAEVIGQQIRLQQVGGQVMIDFIDPDRGPAWDAMIDRLKAGLPANARLKQIRAWGIVILRLPYHRPPLFMRLRRDEKEAP